MGNYLYPTQVDVNPIPLSKLIVVLYYIKIHVQSNKKNNNLLIPEEIAQVIALFLTKIQGIIEPETEFVFEKYRRYYHIVRKQPLRINKYIKLSPWEANNDGGTGGVIQIYCKNKLIILENGCIDANGCGYTQSYGRGKGKQRSYNHDLAGHLAYNGGGGHATKGCDYGTRYHGVIYNKWVISGGIKYGDKCLKTLSFGSPSGSWNGIKSGGGGIIELIAPIIINYGSILSSGGERGYGGSGGSIKIKTKTFINKGTISVNGAEGGAGGYLIAGGGAGYIAIYCEEYENYGNIEPNPHTFIEYENYYPKNKIIKFTKINHEYKR